MTTPNMRDFFIILDKSTSMSSCREAAVNHFNQTVRDIKKGSIEFNGETRVSFITFATDVYFKFWRQPLSKLREIQYDEFVPGGWTALHDDIGMTLAKFVKDIPDANHPIFVSVITDGCENNSEKYKNNIASMIKELQAKGNWTFTYLGANHDVVTAATSMGFPAGNTAVFTSTNSGVKGATKYASSRMGSYMRDLNNGGLSVNCFYSATGEVTDLREDSDDNAHSVVDLSSAGNSASILSVSNSDYSVSNNVQITNTDVASSITAVVDLPDANKKNKSKYL